MTEDTEVSSSLQEWAALAGYTLTPASTSHDGRALFWSAGGEVRLFLESRDDSWFIVTRSERLGEEHFEFAATSSSTIDKYLFGNFGQSIRSNRGLPVIPAPKSLSEISAGFSIETRQFDGKERLALIAPDGSIAGVSSGGKLIATASLIELSLYLNATIEDIMASCLDPEGKPLYRRG
jgi:immunity protein 61 of polymorphic toxin system